MSSIQVTFSKWCLHLQRVERREEEIKTGIKSWLWHSLAISFWAKFLNSLYLDSHTDKIKLNMTITNCISFYYSITNCPKVSGLIIKPISSTHLFYSLFSPEVETTKQSCFFLFFFFLMVLTGWDQGVSWSTFSSGSSLGKNMFPSLVKLFGRIYFLMIVGLRPLLLTGCQMKATLRSQKLPTVFCHLTFSTEPLTILLQGKQWNVSFQCAKMESYIT